MSQHEQILKYLSRKGRKLTVLTALQMFGIYALSQRIGELKRLNYPIQSKMVDVGNGKRVKEYWMKK